MLEVFLEIKGQCAHRAHKIEGAIFGELYGSCHCENGQAPVSSVPICSAILEDDLDSALT